VKVFVDTSGWYAYFDKSDRFHAEAASFIGRRPTLLTSDLVVSETLALLQRRINKAVSQKVGEILLDRMVVELLIPSFKTLQESLLLYEGTSRKLSFVDCSNKILMAQNDLDTIFCFDEDFKGLGLKVVP
jgi:predicted nucleic acid-binding protein